MSTLIIPYFQTSRYRVQTMVELAEIVPGEKGIDLGSGDGRIVIAFAEKQMEMHGYEIDAELIKKSREHIKKSNLQTLAYIHNESFWHIDVSPFAVVTIYGMPDVMIDLEKKLQAELKPGARVLSNYYPFPTWKESMKKDNVLLYKK